MINTMLQKDESSVQQLIDEVKKLDCPICSQRFDEKDKRTQHMHTFHQFHSAYGELIPTCSICKKTFKKFKSLKTHYTLLHRNRGIQPYAHSIVNDAETTKEFDDLEDEKFGIFKAKRIFLDSFTNIMLLPKNTYRDHSICLSEALQIMKSLCDRQLKKLTGLKVTVMISPLLFKVLEPEKTATPGFWSDPAIILRGDDLQQKLESIFPKLNSAVESYLKEGSGWVVDHILTIEFHLAQYQPLKAGSEVKLPDFIAATKAVMAMKAPKHDQMCFLWCFLANKYPEIKNANRASKYKNKVPLVNLKNILFPFKMSQMSLFERQNDVCINVYTSHKKIISPLRISSAKSSLVLNLYYLRNHFFLIRSLDRFLSHQIKSHCTKYFCHRCLIPQYKPERLDFHLKMCLKNEATRIEMPKEKQIKFKNHYHAQRLPLTLYSDFECILTPIKSCLPNPSSSFEVPYQHHEACGFGILPVLNCCGSQTYQKPIIYRGADCARKFLENVIDIVIEYRDKLENPVPVELDQTHSNVDEQGNCHICSEVLNEKGVIDHCHICGKFRGITHNTCNQNYRLYTEIVVVIHNLRRYDGHLIMDEIGKICNQYDLLLDCVPKSLTDYIGFTLRKPKSRRDPTPKWTIRFRDRFRFLSTSLDNLAQSLPREKFVSVDLYSPNPELFCQKGVYPYDYIDSWEKFKAEELPPKEGFYNRLQQAEITDDQYAHAQKVWKECNVDNIGTYHDLYLLADILILADVFEAFRSVAHINYTLDPLHYFTLPSYAWSVCLKLTGVVLDTIQDENMYLMFEEGKRGGLSVILHRLARANNPFCPGFKPEFLTKFLLYLDATNLYGWAMRLFLPVRALRWLARSVFSRINWRNQQEDQPEGYILKVDLKYPHIIHRDHSDYPFCPEHVKCTEENLSPFSKQLLTELNMKFHSSEKLIASLNDKKEYVIHYMALKQALDHGVQLDHVHCVIAFEQSPWLRPYIDLNANLRKNATTDFERALYKLMNNAVFGESMENVRGHKDVALVSNKKRYLKLVKTNRYKRSRIFNPELAGVIMKKAKVKLDKPLYVGFSILDLSKTLMYWFHYDVIRKIYKNDAKLVFTDTDSFLYQLTTQNVYDDIKII